MSRLKCVFAWNNRFLLVTNFFASCFYVLSSNNKAVFTFSILDLSLYVHNIPGLAFNKIEIFLFKRHSNSLSFYSPIVLPKHQWALCLYIKKYFFVSDFASNFSLSSRFYNLQIFIKSLLLFHNLKLVVANI